MKRSLTLTGASGEANFTVNLKDITVVNDCSYSLSRAGRDLDCTFEQGLGGPRDWTRAWDPARGEVVNMPVRQVYNDYRYRFFL